jgi:hypothetical protein
MKTQAYTCLYVPSIMPVHTTPLHSAHVVIVITRWYACAPKTLQLRSYAHSGHVAPFLTPFLVQYLPSSSLHTATGLQWYAAHQLLLFRIDAQEIAHTLRYQTLRQPRQPVSALPPDGI